MSGIDAYKKAITQTATTRDTEYRLLAQVTSELIKAIENSKGAETDPIKMSQVASALNWNKQVWDVFVEDCGSAGISFRATCVRLSASEYGLQKKQRPLWKGRGISIL